MTIEHKLLTLIDQGVTDRDLIIRIVGGSAKDKLRRMTPDLVEGGPPRLTATGIARLDRLNGN